MKLPLRVLFLLLALPAFHAPLDAQKSRGDRHRITLEEIHASPASNLYDAVRALRPAWLRTRGHSSLQLATVPGGRGDSISVPAASEIVVYVDGVRFGTQSSLRDLAPHDVAAMEYLDAGAATQRWGTGHPHGAILVSRRR